VRNKFILLFVVGIVACSSAFAQLRREDEDRRRRHVATEEDIEAGFRYNGHDYAFGVSIGSTHIYANLPISNPQPAYMAYVEKNIYHYLTVGTQITVGDLSSRWPKNRLYSFNHFTAIDEHLNISAGALFAIYNRAYNDHILPRIIGGIYGGVGIGVVNNNIKRISNEITNLNWTTTTPDNPVIVKNSNALYYAFNVGYNYRVQKFLFFNNGFVFNFNFQLNDCQSDYIDGYSPPFKGHRHTAVYTVMSLGAKIYITHKAPDNIFFDQ